MSFGKSGALSLSKGGGLLPYENELPTIYADRIGRWYAASVSVNHKKRLGQYLTPVEVAKFMAELCNLEHHGSLRVLDPGAGTGVLSCALCEILATRSTKPKEIELEAYEIDTDLAYHLAACLSYTQSWLQKYGVALKFKVKTGDFVMTHAELLNDTLALFPAERSENPFDVVISNPPYFKIPKSDPRAQAATTVVHGQPNIYALFMAVSASLLKFGGEFICISPRSFTTGPYFRLFRERFFTDMRPEVIHLFGSRRDTFSRDDVLQENVVLLARRLRNWAQQLDEKTVKVSFSSGTRDLSKSSVRRVALSEVLDLTSKGKMLRIPVADKDDEIAKIVNSWRGTLSGYGLEISTGPVVPFRATTLIAKTGDVPKTHAPLLWMQNVMAMQVEWPVKTTNKEQYILVSDTSKPLLVKDKSYVLLRRFSAKEQRRRLTAAPLLAGKMNSPLMGA